jgi:hypothetical protein
MIPGNECNLSGIAICVTVLTSGWKTVRLNGQRPFGLFNKLVGQMRLKPHAEPTRAEVVLCGLFSTSKSLESLRAQNVKSPLSAIFVPERLSCIDFLER